MSLFRLWLIPCDAWTAYWLACWGMRMMARPDATSGWLGLCHYRDGSLPRGPR